MIEFMIGRRMNETVGVPKGEREQRVSLVVVRALN